MPLFLRTAKTSNPQGGARINWGNPITRGLVRAILFNTGTPVDLVTGQFATKVSTNFARVATANGPGIKTLDTASYWTIPIRTETWQRMSTLWVGAVHSGGTSGTIIRDFSTSAGTIPVWQNGTTWDGRIGGGNAGSYDLTGGGVFSNDKVYSTVFTTGASPAIFVDGTKVVSGTLTGSYGSLISPWVISHNGANTQGAVATSVLLCMYDRVLTAEEAKALSSNPWQVFAAPASPIFSGFDAAGGVDLAVNAELATAVASGFVTTIGFGNTIAATVATAIADGYLVGVNRRLSLTASIASAVALGFDAALINVASIVASYGIASAAGYQAQINLQRHIAASLAAASASGSISVISTTTGTAFWPTPDQVLSGITYGPTGADYTGTATAGAGTTIVDAISFIVTNQISMAINDTPTIMEINV